MTALIEASLELCLPQDPPTLDKAHNPGAVGMIGRIFEFALNLIRTKLEIHFGIQRITRLANKILRPKNHFSVAK